MLNRRMTMVRLRPNSFEVLLECAHPDEVNSGCRDCPTPSMLVRPSIFQLQRIRNLNRKTGRRIESPLHRLWIAKHTDLSARLRFYRLQNQRFTGPVERKAIYGAAVFCSRESDCLALAPICGLSRPGCINSLSADVQPRAYLFELLDRSRVKSPRRIRSDSDLEVASLSCR